MSIRVSPQPTPAELDTLRLLLPAHIRLEAEEGRVRLVVGAVHDPERRLVQYAVLPGTQADFGGTLLAELVEDLVGTVTTSQRALRDDLETPAELRALDIVDRSCEEVADRHLGGGELKLLVDHIWSVEEADWFPVRA